jgi:hypothetical protein
MIPYPPVARPLPGCSACVAPYSDEQERCTVSGCTMEFCPSCSWHCADCDRVICAHHSQTVGGEQFCAQHAADTRLHYRQMFDSIRADCLAGVPCDCGGQIEDMTDKLIDRTLEEDYGCARCGQVVSKRLNATQEGLRELRAEGYSVPWPDAEYTHTEGTAPAAAPKRFRKVA